MRLYFSVHRKTLSEWHGIPVAEVHGTVFLLQRFIVYALQQRLVIFVHKNYNRGTCGLIRPMDNAIKTVGQCLFTCVPAILVFPCIQVSFQYSLYIRRFRISFCIQINMQHRIYLPLSFLFLYI